MTSASRLTGVPLDRVVQLGGAAAGDVARAVAEHSIDLAAVVTRTCSGWTTPREFVGAMLDELERVAIELLPAWLPEATDVRRADLGGLATLRLMAADRAARARYHRAFLVYLTVLAVTGYRGENVGLPVRVRAVQLARLVADGFGRTRSVLILSVPSALTAPERDAMVAGGEWLAHNAKVAVWFLGAAPVNVDRVPMIALDSAIVDSAIVDSAIVDSAIVDSAIVDSAIVDGAIALPAPVIGKPHPASAVEAALEAALAAESWAIGRRWNQTYQSAPLSPPVRLDLVWTRERCVVELDGPEHCHPARFEADRQRDVQLQLDGYAVLRFTNARVVHDVGAVVHQIGTYIRGRRHDIAKGT